MGGLLKNITFLMILALCMSSCGSNRSTSARSYKLSTTQKKSALIDQAKAYIGTPYLWGGANQQGMDCSGLIYQSFKAIAVDVPRTTEGLMQQGRKISLRKIKPGDLVFFKTLKSKAKATHVGIVTLNNINETYFIHSGTSTGVTISKLQDRYWKKHFVFARRLL